MKKNVPPFDFDCYFSLIDGVPVVHVCTENIKEDKHGPICRVYLNDEPIFENPEYQEDNYDTGED